MKKWLSDNAQIVQMILWLATIVGGGILTFGTDFNAYKEQISIHIADSIKHSEDEVGRVEFNAHKEEESRRIDRVEDMFIRMDDKLDRLIEMQLD